MAGPIHDAALLDALEAMSAEPFAGTVWRVTRAGREPLRGSVGAGRWAPNNRTEILYTCLERDGALAEVGFRLSLEPIWPSRLSHEIHDVDTRSERNARFADVASLVPLVVPLGVDPARWTGFDYTATQSIAAAAHFLEYDGMIVPSARFDCKNLVMFLDRPIALTVAATGAVDWTNWRARQSMDKPRYP